MVLEINIKKANCFIFSLALSDLCSGLVSPIGIYIKTWGFNPFYWPSAFCNVSFDLLLCDSLALLAALFPAPRRPLPNTNLKENKKIKIYWAIEETTSFVTSLHIASFAFFRYLSVCHPHRMAFERRLLVLFLIGLWLGLLLSTENIGGDLFGPVAKSGRIF